MLKLHGFDGLRYALGLAPIHECGLAMLDVAEGTGAGADVAQHQKRRGATAPALTQVGTHSFFTDRVQFFLAHQPLQPFIGLAGGRAHLYPIWAAQRSDVTFGDDPVSCRGNRHKVLFDS